MSSLLNGLFRLFNQELFFFLYELRMQDEQDDRYTNYLIALVQDQNIHPVMRFIIFANKKDGQNNELYWSASQDLRLICGRDFKFVMKYHGGSPYAIS